MRKVYIGLFHFFCGFNLLNIPTQFEIDFGQNILEFLQLIFMGLLDVEIIVII